MNKTRKEIADALGVSKSTVYRVIKELNLQSVEERVGEQGNFTRTYDEQDVNRIMNHLNRREPVHEPLEPVHEPHRESVEPVREPLHEPLYESVIETLKQELEQKNEEINRLLVALDQEQKLHAATKQLLLEKQESDAEPETKKSIGSWFRKWRKGSAGNETVNSESE